MFSLIVSSDSTAWETDQLMRMFADRFNKYSGAEGVRISLNQPGTLAAVDGSKALLMYETGTTGPAGDTVRYGLLRNVSLAGEHVTFQFTEEGRFSRSVVREFGDRLGINPRNEYGHTHWAIKDGNIPSAMLAKLQQSYDVVLSFAGEDRKYVHAVAKYLRSTGVKVFYDTFEQANLWGKDLAEHLDSVYQHAGKYCVIFISKSYAEKMWTKHERRSALARALRQQGEYILPARFDGTELEGIRHTTAYISASDKTPAKFSKLILEKLGRRVATLKGKTS